jgi:hypothetical protein
MLQMDPTTLSEFNWLYKVLGLLTGFVISVLLGAYCLNLAARMLRMGKVPFLVCLKCVLLANVSAFMMNVGVGFNYGLVTRMGSGSRIFRSPEQYLTMGFSPIFMLLAALVGLLIATAIYARLIPDNQTLPRLGFLDAFALASIQQALTIFGILILTLFIFMGLFTLSIHMPQLFRP